MKYLPDWGFSLCGEVSHISAISTLHMAYQ